MRVKLVRVIRPESTESSYDYSAYKDLDANFLVPLEVIYRNRLIENSSLMKRIKRGEVDLILAQMPAQMGALCVEWGVKHLNEGAEIPKKVTPGFFVFTQENVNDPDAQQYIYK